MNLKFFNEWPKATEKISDCDCSRLNGVLKEKDEVIEVLRKRLEEYENEMNSTKEYHEGIHNKVQQLEEVNMRLQEKLSGQNEELLELKTQCDRYKRDFEVTEEHLKNVEFSFNDVHSKYERTKSIIEELRINENNLRKCTQAHEKTIALLIHQYTTLKQYTMKQFEDANIWVHKTHQDHRNATEQLQSKIKNLEQKNTALERSLQQRVLENENLSVICNEIVNKKSFDETKKYLTANH